uniref:CD209 antigen-like protein E isoform X3 n=1 Tax=Gasterosteus aculeatus aculeatus TaxID=481459 RepID=UPI001A980310|nr:CD209 antigen-like protein E isoform X3 [Gasterosteus aculeatus aculeatus]
MALSASSRKERLYKLVAVSVGLLCILQAAANIGLRLSLYGCTANGKPDLEEIIKNLTEKEEDLKDHYLKQGWVYFDQSFYYISSSQMSWQDSRDDCLQNGSNLIIITSKEEQDFARQFKKRSWIGLTDTETEGTWKWVDGTEPKERYWTTGEPNSYQGSNEDCGEIRFYEEQHNWNDLECSYKNFWICEKALAQ